MATPYWMGAFCRWLAAGKTYPRPPQVPAKIPKLLWPAILIRVAAIKARLVKPDYLVFWRSRGTWVAWGLNNGQFTPGQLAAYAHDRNYAWVGVQDTPALRAKVLPGELKAALDRYGIKLVVWAWATTPEAARESINYWRADAYAANVEHRNPTGTWHRYTAQLRAWFPRPFPFAVFTNFAGAGAMPDGTYSKFEAEAFWGQDFACVTESYMVNEQGPQPNLSPERLNWTATAQCGYPATFPSWGIYRVGYQFYDKYLAAWPHHSWYLTENRYPS